MRYRRVGYLGPAVPTTGRCRAGPDRLVPTAFGLRAHCLNLCRLCPQLGRCRRSTPSRSVTGCRAGISPWRISVADVSGRVIMCVVAVSMEFSRIKRSARVARLPIQGRAVRPRCRVSWHPWQGTYRRGGYVPHQGCHALSAPSPARMRDFRFAAMAVSRSTTSVLVSPSGVTYVTVSRSSLVGASASARLTRLVSASWPRP